MRFATALAAALLFVVSATPLGQQAVAPAVERIADGIELQRLDDPSLLNPAGPVAVQALKLDPRKVTLEIGVAGDTPPARETVTAIAARTGALAAVNAGFFVLADGRPAGLLKVRGQLLRGSTRARGAVAFLERRGQTLLLFDRVTAERESRKYQTRLGSSSTDWGRAGHAIAGAGLLLLNGRTIDDWADENISAGFDTTRHPRTMIGDDGTAIWLVTIDGRQPALSLGMSFTELQGLAKRLGLRAALNLDGGGSTTMVVRGAVVNHPSDQTGPRAVSDAIVVLPRK
jgi:exopolysaccharide biosynthesis protein